MSTKKSAVRACANDSICLCRASQREFVIKLSVSKNRSDAPFIDIVRVELLKEIRSQLAFLLLLVDDWHFASKT